MLIPSMPCWMAIAVEQMFAGGLACAVDAGRPKRHVLGHEVEAGGRVAIGADRRTGHDAAHTADARQLQDIGGADDVRLDDQIGIVARHHRTGDGAAVDNRGGGSAKFVQPMRSRSDRKRRCSHRRCGRSR